jgi:O-antigen/teichoic acid export membrane protein
MFDRGGHQPSGGEWSHEAKRQIAVGGGYVLVGWTISVAANFLTTVVLVRRMPHAAYGLYAVGYAAMSLLAVLAGFGLGPAVAAVAPREATTAGAAGLSSAITEARRLAAWLFLLAAIGATLAVVVLAVAFRRGSHQGLKATLAMLPIALSAPVAGWATGTLRATQRPRRLTIATVVGALVGLGVVGSVALVSPSSAVGIGGARGFAAAVAALALVVLSRGPTGASRDARRDPALRRRLLAQAAAMLLASTFAIVIAQLDVLVLGLVRGARAAAIYQPASRVVDVMLGLPAVIGGFYLPTAARAITAADSGPTRELYHWASRWSVVLCSPAVGVGLVCPGALLHVLFGSGFGAAVSPLRILTAAVAVHVALGLNGVTLDAYGDARSVAIRTAIAALVGIGACAVFIPALGPNGAALATGSAIIVANVLCSTQLFRRHRVGPLDRPGMLTVGALVGAVVACGLGVPAGWPDLATVALVAVATGGTTLLASVAGGGPTERRRIAAAAPWAPSSSHGSGE